MHHKSWSGCLKIAAGAGSVWCYCICPCGMPASQPNSPVKFPCHPPTPPGTLGIPVHHPSLLTILCMPLTHHTCQLLHTALHPMPVCSICQCTIHWYVLMQAQLEDILLSSIRKVENDQVATYICRSTTPSTLPHMLLHLKSSSPTHASEW